MSEDRNISGGFHVSGDATVHFTGSGVAAGENSSATVHVSQAGADQAELVARLLALVERLRLSTDPGTVRAAEDLGRETVSPARSWDRVLEFLARAGQGLAATATVAGEIRLLDTAVRALLP
ncbi:hypothetical protein ACFCX4_07170 [Kitasatospora sp. NPDC056327]|uniref:hypothetical protein n=1 Tax=Kitasatospora sp. NPDC056327 TaxID=3345785 RepID=UPI0035D96A90